MEHLRLALPLRAPRGTEAVHRLGSLGYQTGPSEPQLTTTDGLRARSG